MSEEDENGIIIEVPEPDEVETAEPDANTFILSRPVADARPDISGLKPAYIDGRFTPVVGDKIVVEVNAPGGLWLHTREYIVQTMDDSGDMRLWNDDLGQHAAINHRTAVQAGFNIRMAPGRGRPIGAKRRGRRPKDPSLRKTPLPKPVEFDAQGNPIKRKRGRPPGSKTKVVPTDA